MYIWNLKIVISNCGASILYYQIKVVRLIVILCRDLFGSIEFSNDIIPSIIYIFDDTPNTCRHVGRNTLMDQHIDWVTFFRFIFLPLLIFFVNLYIRIVDYLLTCGYWVCIRADKVAYTTIMPKDYVPETCLNWIGFETE